MMLSIAVAGHIYGSSGGIQYMVLLLNRNHGEKTCHTRCGPAAWQEKGTKQEDFKMACLTSKELSALGDQLNSEQILVRKYRSMSCSCADKQMKNHFDAIAGAHQAHYEKMKAFLG